MRVEEEGDGGGGGKGKDGEGGQGSGEGVGGIFSKLENLGDPLIASSPYTYRHGRRNAGRISVFFGI